MKQVAAILRDLAFSPPKGPDLDTLWWLLNREFGPVLKELRRRFNERHGVVRVLTASATLNLEDEFVFVDATDGEVTVTLPTIADATRPIHIKKVDASANAVNIESTVEIDGAATQSLTGQWWAVAVAPYNAIDTADSTWYILAEFS